MRHTAFLVLGEDSSNISAAIRRYVLMYGKGGSNDFFKLYNWNVSDNGLHIVSAFSIIQNIEVNIMTSAPSFG